MGRLLALVAIICLETRTMNTGLEPFAGIVEEFRQPVVDRAVFGVDQVPCVCCRGCMRSSALRDGLIR